MTKTKNKTKALKTKSQNNFFRALFFGFVSCILSWIVLALVFAFVMSKQSDSNSLGNVFSVVVAALSLVVGGFVSGKCNKDSSLLSSFILGCAFLGICYLMSTALDLSKNMDAVMKTVTIAVMLLCPVFGSKLSMGKTGDARRRRKRL